MIPVDPMTLHQTNHITGPIPQIHQERETNRQRETMTAIAIQSIVIKLSQTVTTLPPLCKALKSLTRRQKLPFLLMFFCLLFPLFLSIVHLFSRYSFCSDSFFSPLFFFVVSSTLSYISYSTFTYTYTHIHTHTHNGFCTFLSNLSHRFLRRCS